MTELNAHTRLWLAGDGRATGHIVAGPPVLDEDWD